MYLNCNLKKHLFYSPALLANSTEFLPINSMTNLASVPEEPVRIITPPPREQIINEIIELGMTLKHTYIYTFIYILINSPNLYVNSLVN